MKEKAFLKLGCWGYEKEGMVLCKGIENDILDLTKNTEKNIEITKFLNDNYQLVRKPLLNNVHTALFKIQDRYGPFDERHFRSIEEFCILHKKCGQYLKIEWEE